MIIDKKAILDTKLYQVKCQSKDEAFYLLAIINRNALKDAVEPLVPGGLFGRIRDIHKHLWKLPIPLYDITNIAQSA